MLKWNKKVNIAKANPYLLNLKKSIKDPLIDNNTIKAKILIASFFFKTRIINLNNINIKAIIKQKVFNISPIILVKEINKLIKSLLNGKALRPNNIPNKVFKMVALVIKKDFAEVASYCFINGIAPEYLKEFITVVLYKDRKKDYSLLGSYRLIALKNMLAKVLEKYIANIISKAVEEYRLLL